MPQGLIVRAISGYYYVVPQDQPSVGEAPVQCRARGLFKKKKESPLVGDRVIFEYTENGEGTVTKLLPRTSSFIRPPVANIDQVVLVFALKEPELSLLLLDKFIMHMENNAVDALICFNKSDLLSEQKPIGKSSLLLQDIVALYENAGYPVVVMSTKQHRGLAQLVAQMSGKINAFAGQSGAGKTSLLNTLIPGGQYETGEISARLGRGKHTTREVALVPLPHGGMVADTPGFSQLDYSEIGPEDVGSGFKEFRAYVQNCKFRGCLHDNEPGCAVIAAVDSGDVSPSRYTHYKQFLSESKEWKRRNPSW